MSEQSGPIELQTEEPQRNRVNTWQLYWFHKTDPDANYKATPTTLRQAGFVPLAQLTTERARYESQLRDIRLAAKGEPVEVDYDSGALQLVQELKAENKQHCLDFQAVASALGILDELPEVPRVLERIGELRSESEANLAANRSLKSALGAAASLYQTILALADKWQDAGAGGPTARECTRDLYAALSPWKKLPPAPCPACLADPAKFGIIGHAPIVPLPVNPMATEGNFTISLSEYHVVNLRELIRCCGYDATEGAASRAVFAYNTGDWLGELWLKLEKFGPCKLAPNKTLGQVATEAKPVDPPTDTIPGDIRCRVTGKMRCQCVGCWPNWPNPEAAESDRKRPAPEYAVEGAIAFLRENWRGNDGAEGDAVKLVCDELERMRAASTEAKPAWEQDVTQRLREERDHYRDIALGLESPEHLRVNYEGKVRGHDGAHNSRWAGDADPLTREMRDLGESPDSNGDGADAAIEEVRSLLNKMPQDAVSKALGYLCAAIELERGKRS